MLALISPLTFFSLVQRWGDLRGSYFVDSSSYAVTQGLVTTADTYRVGTRYGTNIHYEITYIYVVDGRSYQSRQVTFASTGSSDAQFAQGYLNKYPAGTRVSVFYLPTEPGFAVLEPGEKSNFLWHFANILLGVIFATAYGFSWVRERMRW